MILAVLFFLLCIAGSAAIAILLRDDYTFKQINQYIALVQEHGDDSAEEYAFRERAQTPIGDLCHLIRASRDDAKFRAVVACEPANKNFVEKVLVDAVKKSKRTPRGNRGKK